MSPSALVLGVPVDDVTMAEAVERICQFVVDGRRTGRTHQVATVNADFVVNALDDDDNLALLQHTELSIPDGMTLVWGSRFLGVRLRQRVTGVDLLPALARRAAQEGYSMYLFGAAPGIAERAAALLRAEYGADVIGDAGPVFKHVEDMDPGALAPIRAARPDIVCVALGHPKQERWIARYRHELGAPVLIGVGGTFDIMVGEKRRAPDWLGRMGLEWLFRTAQEPGRLARRYGHDMTSFLPRLADQVWSFRPRSGDRWGVPQLLVSDHQTVVATRGRFVYADLDELDLKRVMVPGNRIIVDLACAPFIDNATASCLVALARTAWISGAELYLASVSTGAERCLKRHRVADLLPRWPGEATPMVETALAAAFDTSAVAAS